MRGSVKAFLWAAMAAALILAGVTGAGIRQDRERLAEMTRSLAESRARWESTAEKKEKLQEELKTVTGELREAKLTLEESTQRAGELQEDIAELEREIAELREKTAGGT